MADPISERVLAEMERRANTIPMVPACGRVRVFRARRSLSESELPAVVIWEDGEEAGPGTASGNTASIMLSLRFTAEAHVAADKATTGRALSTMKASVKTALCIGNGAISDSIGEIGVLTYTGADVIARTDGANSEAIALHFTTTFKEAYGDPTRTR